MRRAVKLRWRFFKTEGGADPIGRFLDELSEDDAVQVTAAMADVRKSGIEVSKHLRGEIYEVLADAKARTIRILFALEGKRKRVLLAVVAFDKKTQKTPPRFLALAEKRLAEWRERGKTKRLERRK